MSTFSFAPQNRKHSSFNIAKRTQGSNVRKQFGITGVRSAFSKGSMSAHSERETILTRYERLRSECGRSGSYLNMPEIHPHRGTPEYHNFYKRKLWLNTRDRMIAETPFCACCGATRDDKDDKGVYTRLELDHIKPRLLFPELEENLDNFQVLCSRCNKAKANLTADNWRVGSIPYGARDTFWHKHPENYDRRMFLAKILESR